MKSKWIVSFSVAVLLVGLVVGAALAMNSENYRLDWNEELSASSVAASSASTNYKTSNSFGAFLEIRMNSTNYKAELGFWPGAYPHGRQTIPYVRK